MKMKVEGGAELQKALTELSTRLSKKVMREALETAGEPIRKSMQLKAPRAPGAPDLADHMVIGTARGENKTTSAISIGPEKGFFYGFFQEFGTSRHGAQPFARPAFDGGVSKALSDIIRATWTILASRGISRTSTSDAPVQSPGGGDLL